MNQKRRWHHFWTKLRVIASWYFVFGLVLSSGVAVMSLRHNNLTALYLRDQVQQADQQNADVELPLRTLRKYVYAHMNTDLSGGPNTIRPPIQLRYRYEKLVATEKTRVSTINTKVYSEAQASCEILYPHGLSGGGRVPCIQDYIDLHGVKEQTIPDGLYKFDFVSPVWSPDVAGYSLIVAGVMAVLLVLRLTLEYLLRRYLRSTT